MDIEKLTFTSHDKLYVRREFNGVVRLAYYQQPLSYKDFYHSIGVISIHSRFLIIDIDKFKEFVKAIFPE